MKVAALEIAPAWIHLTVATVSAEGAIALLGDYVQEVPLATGLAAGGPIQKETVEQALRVVRSFRHIIRQQSVVDQVRVCAVASFEGVAEFKPFANKVLEHMDVPVEQLAAPDETAYRFLGAYDTVPLRSGGAVATVHVGSDFTGVAIGEGQRLLEVQTLRTGTDALTRKFVDAPHPTAEQCLALSEHLNRVIDLTSIRKAAAGRSVTLVGSGRAATSLAAMASGSAEPDQTKIHGAQLSLETVYQWYELIAQTPVSQRSEFPGLPLSYAKEILAGVGVLLFVLDKLEIAEITISAAGLCHGMVREMLGIERPFS